MYKKGIRGTYRYNEGTKTLFKFITSNTAILWKTRELSLPEYVVTEMIPNVGAETMSFIDKEKCIRYSIDTTTLQRVAKLKQEGQEPQYYIGLEHFIKKEYSEPLSKLSEETIVENIDVTDKVL